MTVDFINVGYGDAILIENNGRIILVDGGGNREDMYSQPATVRTIDYLRQKNIKKIDIVIITHFHEDHICGLVPVLEEIETDQIWINVLVENIPNDFIKRIKKINNDKLNLFIAGMESYIRIIEIAYQKQIPIIEMCNCVADDDIVIEGNTIAQQDVYRGQVFNMFCEKNIKKLELMALSIDRTANENSLIVKIKGEDGSAYLMGDRIINSRAINEESNIKLLKLPHHGQAGCITEELLEYISPENVVITSDKNNTFGGGSDDIVDMINNFYKKIKSHGKVYVTGKENNDGRYKSNISFSI